jgi:PAS domain S-box-containing protein
VETVRVSVLFGDTPDVGVEEAIRAAGHELVGDGRADVVVVAAVAQQALARCAEVRSHHPGAVMLALTPDEGGLEALLAAGIDDHLIWPRDGGLLGARLRVLERRSVALRLSEERLRAIIDLATDCIFMKDPAGRYVLINRAGAALFARPVAEVLGRTDEELLGPELGREIRAIDEQVIAAGGPVTYERARVMAGEEHAFITVKVPYVSPAGDPLGIIGIAHDITERKRLETRLFLADRMVSVGTLAAGVAHEVNNPLAYVIGNLDYARTKLAEVLAGQAPIAELPDVLSSIDDSIEGTSRMREIVRDLRTFARAEEAEPAPVDLSRVIDVSLRMTQHVIKHRARVEKTVAPDVPPVHGNSSRLGQVFVNLLVNSAQAMPPSRDPAENRITVRISTEGAKAARVVVELSDNGVGISEAVRRRIFDPFVTTKPAGEGTGLGLWVCKNIVTAMGGDITVESQPGEGSVFRLTLPASAAAPTLEPAAAPPPRRAAPRPRLLVVDDEQKMVVGLRRMLGGDNEVLALTDAREALARIVAGERFDAVLCDLMMPGMSGMEFYAELEKVAPGIAEHTGFVTGGAVNERAREFLNAERRERTLFKPFEIEALRTFVRQLLN